MTRHEYDEHGEVGNLLLTTLLFSKCSYSPDRLRLVLGIRSNEVILPLCISSVLD